MKLTKSVALILASPLLLTGAGCKKAAQSVEPSVSYAQIDNATAGTIAGTIQFAGKSSATRRDRYGAGSCMCLEPQGRIIPKSMPSMTESSRMFLYTSRMAWEIEFMPLLPLPL